MQKCLRPPVLRSKAPGQILEGDLSLVPKGFLLFLQCGVSDVSLQQMSRNTWKCFWSQSSNQGDRNKNREAFPVAFPGLPGGQLIFKYIKDTYKIADSTKSHCVHIIPLKGWIFNGSTDLRERLKLLFLVWC